MIQKVKRIANLISNMGTRYVVFRISYLIKTKFGWHKKTFPTNPGFKKYISLQEWKDNLQPFYVRLANHWNKAGDKSKSLEYFKKEIQPKLIDKNILISAHGNSIRSLCKYLFKLDNNQITSLEIPTGNPLIMKLDDNLKINECKYLDKERSKNLLVF